MKAYLPQIGACLVGTPPAWQYQQKHWHVRQTADSLVHTLQKPCGQLAMTYLCVFPGTHVRLYKTIQAHAPSADMTQACLDWEPFW